METQLTENLWEFIEENGLDFKHGSVEYKFQHGTTPHKELKDFKPKVKPLIMYKQFKLRLDKNGNNLAPGYVFPLYVNTEGRDNVKDSSGLKIGVWYKSGEGACWLNTKNGKCYTRGKGYNTDGKTIDILSYRPGWHLTTTPWGNQRGATKVTNGAKGTGNNYMNTWDSEVWAKVEICVDVDATEKARSMSNKPVEQCLSHLEDSEYYKYKTNSNASDDQAWYIVDKIRIIDILDDDMVDNTNDEYYKRLSNSTGRQIFSDPSNYISKDDKSAGQYATRAKNSKTGEDDFVIPYWKMPRVNGKRYTKDELSNMGYDKQKETNIGESVQRYRYARIEEAKVQTIVNGVLESLK